jgi:hypothetical protein
MKKKTTNTIRLMQLLVLSLLYGTTSAFASSPALITNIYGPTERIEVTDENAGLKSSSSEAGTYAYNNASEFAVLQTSTEKAPYTLVEDNKNNTVTTRTIPTKLFGTLSISTNEAARIVSLGSGAKQVYSYKAWWAIFSKNSSNF